MTQESHVHAETSAPTLDEVAAVAGVSRSTASRALNGGARVSPQAQAAVDEAAAKLHYVPNRAARSLVTRRTNSIALIIPEPDELVLSDPFIGGMLRGVGAALAHRDLQLILLISRSNEGSGRLARYLRAGHVDGAVIASHHREDGLEAAVSSAAIPAVFVGRPFASEVELIYTDVDNLAGARLATEHLVARGRRRIAHIGGPQNMTASLDRAEGWRQVLGSHAMPTDLFQESAFSTLAGDTAMTQLLTRHPDIDAVFAGSDILAVGAMHALSRLGKTVPEDVAVVGYDDLGEAASAVPPLTTIHNPVVEMASTAVEQLLTLISRGSRPSPEVSSVVFEPRLIVRSSS